MSRVYHRIQLAESLILDVELESLGGIALLSSPRFRQHERIGSFDRHVDQSQAALVSSQS
jgi:putative heme degradation protein